MENREIARLLNETADLMEIAGEDGFRIRSYRNAATTLETFPEKVDDIVCNPDRKVTDIPGVGKGIAVALQEICTRGSFLQLDQLLTRFPASILELLKIQGSVRRALPCCTSITRSPPSHDLERICREEKLRGLPRMGAKLEEKVLRSIAQYKQSAGRYRLNFGKRVADELTVYLAEVPGIENRRSGPARHWPGRAYRSGRFTVHPRVHEVLGHGANKASVRYGLEGL